jgi:hypothetical protein
MCVCVLCVYVCVCVRVCVWCVVVLFNYYFTKFYEEEKEERIHIFCNFFASFLQVFCNLFVTFFRIQGPGSRTFFQRFCNFFPTVLQLFCNFFATFLQLFCNFSQLFCRILDPGSWNIDPGIGNLGLRLHFLHLYHNFYRGSDRWRNCGIDHTLLTRCRTLDREFGGGEGLQKTCKKIAQIPDPWQLN